MGLAGDFAYWQRFRAGYVDGIVHKSTFFLRRIFIEEGNVPAWTWLPSLRMCK
jgi:hypothetical protein